jgi:altronate dehydratase small subunit
VTAAPTWDAIVLDDADGVATALRPLKAGQTIQVRYPGRIAELTPSEAIPLCHKVAVADLEPGEPLRKYGEVIGEASAPILRGAWVHVHNLRSLRGRG